MLQFNIFIKFRRTKLRTIHFSLNIRVNYTNRRYGIWFLHELSLHILHTKPLKCEGRHRGIGTDNITNSWEGQFVQKNIGAPSTKTINIIYSKYTMWLSLWTWTSSTLEVSVWTSFTWLLYRSIDSCMLINSKPKRN